MYEFNKFDEKTEKELEDYFDKAWGNFKYFLENSSKADVKVWIRNRCDEIVNSLLSGDTKYLKDQWIISEYDWEKVQKISLKIWETAGGEIANSLISTLTKENEELKKQLQNETHYRNQ